jgi:uncharacterized paraquat-inducible protein A
MKNTAAVQTLSNLAPDRYVLIGPALVVVLSLFPIVLFLPLLTTKLWFFSRNDLVLFRGVYDLFYLDNFLFIVVFLFGIVIPIAKMFASVLCWYRVDIAFVGQYAEAISLMGKLSMLDIMLLAIFIIAS